MTNSPNTLSFSEAAQKQLAQSLYESWLKSPETLDRIFRYNEDSRALLFKDLAEAAELAAWYICNPDERS